MQRMARASVLLYGVGGLGIEIGTLILLFLNTSQLSFSLEIDFCLFRNRFWFQEYFRFNICHARLDFDGLSLSGIHQQEILH